MAGSGPQEIPRRQFLPRAGIAVASLAAGGYIDRTFINSENPDNQRRAAFNSFASKLSGVTNLDRQYPHFYYLNDEKLQASFVSRPVTGTLTKDRGTLYQLYLPHESTVFLPEVIIPAIQLFVPEYAPGQTIGSNDVRIVAHFRTLKEETQLTNFDPAVNERLVIFRSKLPGNFELVPLTDDQMKTFGTSIVDDPLFQDPGEWNEWDTGSIFDENVRLHGLQRISNTRVGNTYEARILSVDEMGLFQYEIETNQI